MILLAVWRLKDNAYGVTIRRSVMEMTRKKLHYGSLYNTLDLLIRKGLVTVNESSPESVRGGRRKKLYFLSRNGLQALKSAQEMYQSMWDDIPEFAFNKGE